MPRLIPDILFEIGKKLIEDGSQDDVYRFALSGKEPFEAMIRVFASVSYLKLCQEHFYIGWESNSCKFSYERKPHSKLLMNQIGNYVDKFGIHCNNIESYQVIVDKILEQKKLIYFSAGKKCDTEFLDQFLPTFATTLKDVKIPSQKMTEIFRDTLNLESLLVSRYFGHGMSELCCKTEELEIRLPACGLVQVFPLSMESNNLNLSSVKRLFLEKEDSGFYNCEFNEVTKYFTSLELLQYDFTYFGPVPRYTYESYIKDSIDLFMGFIYDDINKVPPKIVLTFEMDKAATNRSKNIDFYKKICNGFECQKSATNYCRFSKTLQSDDPTKSKILELHFFN